jgi:2-polyprenyl-6-methoxyphenol hydroxylase-like FAD-dependent oxidoreductase
MGTTIKTDVIVVGAGPTGLILACQLNRHGVDFVILDKKDGITPFSKALGVHARTLEIYEQIGIAEQAVSQGTIAGKVRLLEGGEVRGEVDLSSVGQGLSQYPFMLVLEQSKNERLLYEYVQSHGKDVLWRTTLESFSQTDEGVTAQIKNSNGETQIVEAKYLVGCDGPKSQTRNELGLAFEGSTFERFFYVADVEIDWQFSHDALQVCLTKNAVVAFFPMPGENRYRIVGAFPEEFAKDESEVLYEEIEQRIRKKQKSNSKLPTSSGFQPIKSTRAASKTSPKADVFLPEMRHTFTLQQAGKGMNTGIQDAYNLAWKLAFVLQGKAHPKILETYNAERLENAENLLETTDRMFSLVAGTDWLVNLIRTTVFPPMAKYILVLMRSKNDFFR